MNKLTLGGESYLIITTLGMSYLEVRDEKTFYDFTFVSDSMLYGRLPRQGSDGRA
jgi:hypothetical protein